MKFERNARHARNFTRTGTPRFPALLALLTALLLAAAFPAGSQTPAGGGARLSPAADDTGAAYGFKLFSSYNVPQLGHNQGTVTDFNFWWQMDTTNVVRWSRHGGNFTLEAANNTPFEGLKVNHIAPGYTNAGDRLIYGIANDAGSQGKSTLEYILGFDSMTLARVGVHQVVIPAADGGEGGGGALTGICVVPGDGPNGTIYASDYYTNRIYKFDGASYAYRGFLQLNQPVHNLQGICFSGDYLVADSDLMDTLFWIDRQTGRVVNSVGIHEVLPWVHGVPEGICAVGNHVVLTIETKATTNAFVLSPTTNARKPGAGTYPRGR